MGKKTSFKTTALITVLGSTLLGGNATGILPQNATVVEVPVQTIQLTQGWDKTFPKSDKVDHHKVTFKNRYGLALVGDLYVPKNAKGRLPAIAVSGPFGAVKEQTSGFYAQTLAERGLVTIIFDGSYTGESSGTPRNVLSPEINTEDFSTAVGFLGSLDNVNRDEIRILGVCGWGGFTLNVAVSDPRIKAVAANMTYDMTRVTTNGYEIRMQANADGSYDHTPAQSADARYKIRLDTSNARWGTSKNGYTDLLPPINLDPKEDFTTEAPKFVKEHANFYRIKRGHHPRGVNSNPDASQTVTGMLPLINTPILKYTVELKAPALVVHDEIAHSRYFGGDAYKALGNKDKELYIVPDATHTDLYNNGTSKIPFDKFEQFFKAKLE